MKPEHGPWWRCTVYLVPPRYDHDDDDDDDDEDMHVVHCLPAKPAMSATCSLVQAENPSAYHAQMSDVIASSRIV